MYGNFVNCWKPPWKKSWMHPHFYRRTRRHFVGEWRCVPNRILLFKLTQINSQVQGNQINYMISHQHFIELLYFNISYRGVIILQRRKFMILPLSSSQLPSFFLSSNPLITMSFRGGRKARRCDHHFPFIFGWNQSSYLLLIIEKALYQIYMQ